MNKKIILYFLAILVIAVFFRFWQLAEIPPGLYPDVAINGTNALEALKTHDFKVFYSDNNGREGFFINIIALSIWLLGPSVFAIKLVAAIFGILTVVGLFFFTRNLFGFFNRQKSDFIALLATFLISVGFWHVNFSRIGFRAIMIPLILVWSFYLLFKGVNAILGHKSHAPDSINKTKLLAIVYWLTAGIIFGLGFHTYISFRVAPLILIPPLLFTFLAVKDGKKTALKKALLYWAIFFVFVLIVAAPIGYYFLTHSQDFIGRAGQVSVFSSDNPVKGILISGIKTLSMFNLWGDCNWRHNYACRSQLLWPVGIFFLIGAGYSFFEAFRPKNWRDKNWLKLNAFWTLIFMFLVMLLPSILSKESIPHALRSIGAIPSAFIFAGLGIALTFWLLKRKLFDAGVRPILLSVVLVTVLFSIGCAEFKKYFLDWGIRTETKDEFSQRYVDIANFLNSLPNEITKYVLVNVDGVPVPYPDGIPMPAQTIMYLTRGKPNIKYLVPSQNDTTYLNKDIAVLIMMRDNEKIFSDLKQSFPQGKFESINNEFLVFKIGF